MIYGNETKVKDIPESHLKVEIEALLKGVMLDLGQVLAPDIYSHTVNRLTYLIGMKYKALMVGEVKYIFEAMTEDLKGKISVQSIMQLFSKFFDAKIEKQRQRYEEIEMSNIANANNSFTLPLGRAIIYKMELLETGQLTKENWETVSLKEVAEKIMRGEINVHYRPDNGKVKHTWDF